MWIVQYPTIIFAIPNYIINCFILRFFNSISSFDSLNLGKHVFDIQIDLFAGKITAAIIRFD
jgi:hypothetical protein